MQPLATEPLLPPCLDPLDARPPAPHGHSGEGGERHEQREEGGEGEAEGAPREEEHASGSARSIEVGGYQHSTGLAKVEVGRGGHAGIAGEGKERMEQDRGGRDSSHNWK